MLSGENGIITQAEKSTIKNDNATVLESLRLKISEYIADNGGNEVRDKLYLLHEDNIIDNESVINVEKLVGQKLKTGNGNDNKDIYIIEENRLYYYTKKEEKIDLGDLGSLGNILPETDSNLFILDDEGNLSLRYLDDYYNGTKEWTVENLVIPKEIDGKTVKNVNFNLTIRLDNLKTVDIPDTVTSIGYRAFSFCTNLTSITIPNSVTSMGESVFSEWTSSQTINVPFKENKMPRGWSSYWKYDCDATINYLQ